LNEVWQSDKKRCGLPLFQSLSSLSFSYPLFYLQSGQVATKDTKLKKIIEKVFFEVNIHCFFLKIFFVGLPYLATYIFSYFSTNEPELGAGIDPGIAFPISI
jgi:hypothetical protein